MKAKLLARVLIISIIVSIVGCKKEKTTTPVDVIQTDTLKFIDINTNAKGVHNISGVNWADGRDNFVDGWVILSGLTVDDSYNTVTAKTESVLNGFATNINGVNTIRIPVNPPSVLEAWWGKYKGVIDRATAKKFRVIIACWESASSKNGLIDDVNQFWQMWDVIVNAYQTNTNVYFEPFNEPHGYSLSQLTTIYQQFLDRYPSAERSRIVLGGTGYSEDVKGVGADSRFSNCLLGVHNYAFWTTRTASGWLSDWRNRIGSYAARTIITEFGAAMSTGKDYRNGPQSDNEIAYIVSTSDVCRNDNVASVYWPGLRDGDSYSMLTRGGSGNNITISTVNASGVFRLRYGWGY